jgi:hypothetical protein
MLDYTAKLINIIYLIDIYQFNTHFLSIMQVVNSTKFVNKITEALCSLLTKSNLTLYFMKIAIKLIMIFSVAGFVLASCEGPQGTPGKDASENCIQCHNANVVEAKAIEFEHSLHSSGEAFEEGTRNNCAPCHSHQGFNYVVKNNTPATFIADPQNAGKFLNSYMVDATTMALPGPIGCSTCHSSLHSTYTQDDFLPLTTTAAVPLTMWGGSKTVNFTKASGNLCAKCHQPRPVTNSAGNVIDYSLLVSAPTSNYTLSSVSYRTGVHYGTAAAMAAGTGGIEFGTGYSNTTQHTQGASCASCHMATPSLLSGGHSFTAAGNFAGCNTTGCHTSMTASSSSFTGAQADITAKLATLATKINAIGAGHDILQKDPADNKYHGYIDIYDASSNPTGWWKNPANGTPAFPTLTNAQFGAIINYQLVFRDGSKGVHNYAYIKKLLENTIAAW